MVIVVAGSGVAYQTVDTAVQHAAAGLAAQYDLAAQYEAAHGGTVVRVDQDGDYGPADRLVAAYAPDAAIIAIAQMLTWAVLSGIAVPIAVLELALN